MRKVPIVVIDDEEYYLLREDENGIGVISVEAFNQRFDGATSYAELTEHPNCTPGWLDLFDAWKRDGLID